MKNKESQKAPETKKAPEKKEQNAFFIFPFPSKDERSWGKWKDVESEELEQEKKKKDRE